MYLCVRGLIIIEEMINLRGSGKTAGVGRERGKGGNDTDSASE